jgi:anaphase-promoting complex subunit 10
LVQVKVVENHQNGKDTHVRGLKIYARDEKSGGMGGMQDLVRGEIGGKPEKNRGGVVRETMLTEPDWMGEPELR